jgi:serine/threonine protein kinase
MSDDARKRAKTPVTPLSETGIEARSGTRPNAPRAPVDPTGRGPDLSASSAAAASVNLSAGISASSSTPRVLPSGPAPVVNAVVAGYEVLGELGRGAMGVVYKARHLKLNRVVALKMVLGGRIDQKDLIRFLAEAQAVEAVKHENVVQVYDYGDHLGQPYMALEFCPAGTLSDVLKEEGRLHPTDAAEVVARIAAGMAAAHDRGIVHRDLKPANILLQVEARRGGEELTADEIATIPLEELTPKVSDFGLAKRATSDLTATQAVMGTPAYMSPEQAIGKTKYVGPAADVWALGVILYECLTGTKPFVGETSYEVLAQILSEEPVAVRTVRAKVPYDLELIVKKCLEKAAADRYPTARELSDDLDRFVRGEPISVRPLSAATKAKRWVKRNKGVAALLLLVVLSTFATMGALYSQSRQATEQARADRDAKEAALQAEKETRRREEAEKKQAQAQAREAAAKAQEADAKAQAAQANAIVEMLNDLFRSSDPLAQFFGDAAPALGVGGPAESQAAVLGPFLKAAAARFRGSLTSESAQLTRAKLLAGIGNGMKALGMYPEARSLLEEALAIRRAKLPDTAPEVWQSELDMGRLEGEGGDLLASIERFRKVQELQKRGKAAPELVLNARFLEGMAMSVSGMPESGVILKQVLAERTQLLGPTHRDTMLTKIGLISWQIEHGERSAVLGLFNELSADIKTLPDERLRTIFGVVLEGQVNIVTAFGARGVPLVMRSGVNGLKRNIAKLEELIPPDHLLLCVFRFVVAQCLVELGDAAEAEATYQRVLADARKTVGLSHPRVLTLLAAYTRWLGETKRAADARALFTEVESANRNRFGPQNPWRAVILLKRARFEYQQGDTAAAKTALAPAVELVRAEKFLPDGHSLDELFQTARVVGAAPGEPELHAAARELFAALRPLVAKTYGERTNEMMILTSEEAERAYLTGDRPAAQQKVDDGLRIAAGLARLNIAHWTGMFYLNGRLAMDRGQFAAAEGFFRDAIDKSRILSDFPAEDLRTYHEYRGRALAAQARYPEAAAAFIEARKQLGSKGTPAALLWADFEVATAQLAAGNRPAYDAALAKVVTRCEDRTDAATLSRLAWAGGLAKDKWDAAAFEPKYAAALADAKDPWAWRGLALVRLRAKKLDGVEEALDKAGSPPAPADHLIRGLLAVARDDKAAAKAELAKADALAAARRATAANPYPHADRAWHTQVEEAILRAELRAALGKE